MAQAKKPYHHRNLPAALREATADLVSERGPYGFSLREVARRAGVSHAAPAHHFGDTRGLLTSLAIEGFANLTAALTTAADEPEPATRLRRCGAAYVQTALDYPGHFAVIFQDDLLDMDNAELQTNGAAAFQCLIDSVTAVRDELNPDLDIDKAALLCWSTVQGLVTLLGSTAETSSEDETLPEVIDQLLSLMLDGFLARS